MKDKIKILVTNDDGIDSPGIKALSQAMAKLGDVIVVAPDRQQSAVGHTLTVARPLRVTKVMRNGSLFGYAIDGSPSDCVKIAIHRLLPDKPDLVVSGINHGRNTAINILYSGTVAAATEGMLAGIPSIAISLASHDLSQDTSVAAEYAYLIAKKFVNSNLTPNFLLNVNVPSVPKEHILGIKVAKHSSSYWEDTYEMREDPFGRKYYWFAGEYCTPDDRLDTDDVALESGYVTITPVHFDFTKYDVLDKLSSFEEFNSAESNIDR